ncbi:DUF2274 domain-containing protein [Nostoc sp. 3335mG]|nr:DUF2274 domain-containing protein [Nostoc sp. 3335mG]
MATLKLGPLVDERPTKLTVELPAGIYRDLQAYGALLARSSGDATPIEPARLIAPMLERFMASDRAFTKAQKGSVQSPGSVSE